MKWPLKKIGDVITFRGGGTPRKDIDEFWSDEIPWASVKDFKSLSLTKTQDSISQKGLEASASNLIPAGHVIIPTRMALGKAAINTIDLAINQDLRALIPKFDLDARYLLHTMISLAPQIERRGAGATVKGITQANLASLEIPLPPLAEQKRIAAILDAADDLRTKRRESLAQLDALLQSTFLDLFGDPVTNPKGWDSATLDQVVTSGDRVNYGVVQPGDDFEGGCPLVRVGDFISGELNLSKIKFIDPAIDRQYSRSKLNGSEILISCVGSIGNICKVPGEAVGYNIARAVARVPLNHSVNRDFMVQTLRTKRVQDYFLKETRTVSQPTLNISLIKSAPILLPPLSAQREFADLVCAAERQWSFYRSQAEELETLFASLQSRAFRGEL